MKKYLYLLLISLPLLNVQAEWRITGEAVPGGNAVLSQNPANPSEFTYIGHLSNQWFKITDGANEYVPLCGETDPLADTLDYRVADNPADKGFRIRYAGDRDYFKLTLRTGRTPALAAEEVVPPAHIYLVGGPINTHDPNWLLNDAKELEQDAENPFLFRYKGYLAYNTFGSEPGSIKFLTGLTWDPAYHPQGTADAALSASLKTPAAMRLGGSDTKWTIPADGSKNGYYEISLNTLDETICVDSFRYSSVAYPEKIYITGEAMSCGWVNDFPEAMTPVAGQYGLYSWSGTAGAGEFKFLQATGTWGRCYVATTANEPLVFNQPHSIVYEFEYYNNGGHDYKFIMPEAGGYTIRVDLRNMTMTVVRPGGTAVTLPESRGATIIAGRGKLTIKGDAAEIRNISVFNLAGLRLADKAFNRYMEINLPAGVYIVQQTMAQSAPVVQKVVIP